MIDFLAATGNQGITPLLEELHSTRKKISIMDGVGLANSRGVGNGQTNKQDIARASLAMYSLLRVLTVLRRRVAN